MNRKIAIYSRKSVFTGKGDSVENQTELCKQRVICDYPDMDFNNDLLIFTDEGYSGKNTKRPSYSRMMQKVLHNQIEAIYCYKLDRLSRNVSDFANFLRIITKHNINFCITSDRNFDTTTIGGKAMLQMSMVFAEFERNMIAERVRDNLLLMAKKGVFLGGVPPTGYVSYKDAEIQDIDGNIKRYHYIKQDPSQIFIIKRIFSLYREYGTLSKVCKVLNEEDIKTINNNNYIPITVKAILKNPTYCAADLDARNYFLKLGANVCFADSESSSVFGITPYNRRNYMADNKPMRDIKDWIIAKGKHKPIVSGEEWVKIQNMLSKNNKSSDKKSEHNNYALLSGKIICKKCSNRMYCKKRSNNSNLFDYICETKMRLGNKACNIKNLCGVKADTKIFEALKLQYKDIKIDLDLLIKIKNIFKERHTYDKIYLKTKRLSEIKKAQSAIIKNLKTNALSQAVISALNKEFENLTEQQNNIEQELLESKSKSVESAQQTEKDRVYNECIDILNGDFTRLSIYEKRRFIDIVCDRIEWDGDNLHIHANEKQ